jgi:3D-(3,5/4)-trihydroxycyclohexane-1,2-dione acylhydrolase (decyclizing)
MLGCKIIVVVLDNRGYGCIERLQIRCGGASFNNMLDDCVPEAGERPSIDFARHAAAMGAEAVHVAGIAELRREMRRARASRRSQLLVIDTTHHRTTADGGAWWDVAVPEVSGRAEVRDALRAYLDHRTRQRR